MADAVSDNVYIADLPGEVDENMVRTIFGAYGQVVSCKAMQSKFPGQKGAALVRFSSVEEATWVVTNLNGNIAEGLLEPLKCKFANQGGGRAGAGAAAAGAGAWSPGAAAGYGKIEVPPLTGSRAQPWSAGGGGGGGGGGASHPPSQPSDNVYIADLPGDVDEQLIKTVFGAYGLVMSCKAMQSKFPGQKGAALVRFSSVEEASWLVQNLNGNVAEGLTEPVKVRFAKSSSGAGGAGGTPAAAAAPAAAAGGWTPGVDMGGWTAGYSAGGYDPNAAAAGVVVPQAQAGALAVPSLQQVPGVMGVAPEMAQAQAPGGGKGGGKGKGQPVSNSDIKQVLAGLKQQLPGSGHKKPEENCLYVGGLPANTTDLDLYKLFGCFGAIPATGCTAKMLADGSCAGCGWVDFNDPASAQAASDMLNGLILPDGTVLKVMKKRPKGHGPQQGGY